MTSQLHLTPSNIEDTNDAWKAGKKYNKIQTLLKPELKPVKL